jgi:hypothetical protein
MKQNGQAVRSNLHYFLSLSDHYIKIYTCFGVEHHVFALQWPPIIRATGARKKIKLPVLGKYTELRIFIFPGTAATRPTFWHPKTNQIPKHHLYMSYGISLMP